MGPLLLADNDDVLLAVVASDLRKAGFGVVTASDGDEAIAQVDRGSISMVVLGIRMATAAGSNVWAELSRRPRIPVILLSEKGAEHDALRALETGADDYIIKPFDTRALTARVNALSRRAGVSPTVSVGSVLLDRESLCLDMAGSRIPLSPHEAGLLAVLMSSAGHYVNTETLASEVWGQGGQPERKALKQVIYRLRRKLHQHGVVIEPLRTSRRFGYSWHVEPKPAQRN